MEEKISFCSHVYVEVESDPCSMCGQPSHKTDWKEQWRLHEEWIASGKAVAQGWWSI